jgi:hypothetical protein
VANATYNKQENEQNWGKVEPVCDTRVGSRACVENGRHEARRDLPKKVALDQRRTWLTEIFTEGHFEFIDVTGN